MRVIQRSQPIDHHGIDLQTGGYYLAVLQRKPVVPCANGAPFSEFPPAFKQLPRSHCLRRPRRYREMVEHLGAGFCIT